MALRVIDAGDTVLEVQIVFRNREIGESKMSRAIVIEAMWKVTLWGAARRSQQLRSVLPPVGKDGERDRRLDVVFPTAWF
jgi:hypothetical protein